MELLINPYFLFVLSTYLIWRASGSFDIAASYLTRNLKPGIKGPTINAAASSLPELLISSIFLFRFRDIEGFSAGFATIVGSSIFNVAIIPAIAFLVIFFQGRHKSFPTYKRIILQDGLFLVLAEILLLIALYTVGISLIFALILIGVYLLYIIYIYLKRMKGSDEESQITETHSFENFGWMKNILLLNLFSFFNHRGKINSLNAMVVGAMAIGVIGLACNLLVLSCETIANSLELDLFIVSFVVAAIASSFPDTLLSIKDAQKGKFMDSFSNAYGSNIFDICIGIGLPVLLYLLIFDMSVLPGIANNPVLLYSAILLIGFTIIISLLYYLSNLKLWNTAVIIGLYLLFLWIVAWISDSPGEIAGFFNL